MFTHVYILTTKAITKTNRVIFVYQSFHSFSHEVTSKYRNGFWLAYSLTDIFLLCHNVGIQKDSGIFIKLLDQVLISMSAHEQTSGYTPPPPPQTNS